MNILGKNIKGEQVAANAAGVRFVLVNGQVVGTSSTSGGFDPNSSFQSDRYKTAPEQIRCVCRENANDISGIGAVAAFQAMLPHWESHLAEGHEASIVAKDIHGVKALLDEMLQQIGFAA